MKERMQTAYRAFRATAYRQKNEAALVCGRRSLSYGELLLQIEYTYNTFRQMKAEVGERAAIWLPNQPELIACFYALSRLGGVPLLIHPQAAASEVLAMMRSAGAERLITTPERYLRYCREGAPLPRGKLVLCRAVGEADVFGEDFEPYFLDRMNEENVYNAAEIPFEDAEKAAALFSGSGSYAAVRLAEYKPIELLEAAEALYAPFAQAETIYCGLSLATECGLLAMHGALCGGRCLILGEEAPMALLREKKPMLLIASEGFFWRLRRAAAAERKKYPFLLGGIQAGKPISPLMEKFAARTLQQLGCKGALIAPPLALKTADPEMLYGEDLGIIAADIEALAAAMEGIAAGRFMEKEGRLILQLKAEDGADPEELGRAVWEQLRRKVNRCHLPQSLEFCAYL